MSTRALCIIFILAIRFLLVVLSDDDWEANEIAKFKIICTDNIVQRTNFEHDDIYTDRCSHIIYQYVILHETKPMIAFRNGWTRFNHRYGKRIALYKEKGVKVGIAMGGWEESNYDKYALVVKNATTRPIFVEQAVEFLKSHNLDGLELAWMYPKCWQQDCERGDDDEKEEYGKFVHELRDAFQSAGLFLSSVIAGDKIIIDKGFDLSVLSKHLDWFVVTTEESVYLNRSRTGNLLILGRLFVVFNSGS